MIVGNGSRFVYGKCNEKTDGSVSIFIFIFLCVCEAEQSNIDKDFSERERERERERRVPKTGGKLRVGVCYLLGE